MISTRTPDGEPLQCAICESIHWVLVSDPPRDSVCPTCGSHAWIAVLNPIEIFPSREVSDLLPSLVEQLANCTPQKKYCLFVDGVSLCLSPISARLISFKPIDIGAHGYAVIAARGDVDEANASSSEMFEARFSGHTSLVRRKSVCLVMILFRDAGDQVLLELKEPATLTDDKLRDHIRLAQSLYAITTDKPLPG